jgi:hypothetical protein
MTGCVLATGTVVALARGDPRTGLELGAGRRRISVRPAPALGVVPRSSAANMMTATTPVPTTASTSAARRRAGDRRARVADPVVDAAASEAIGCGTLAR